MSAEQSMVERMARAIDPVAWTAYEHAVKTHGHCKEAGIIVRWADSQSKARAAIAAMREPTHDMRLIGARDVRDSMTEANFYQRSWTCWRAMIDSALNPKETE